MGVRRSQLRVSDGFTPSSLFFRGPRTPIAGETCGAPPQTGGTTGYYFVASTGTTGSGVSLSTTRTRSLMRVALPLRPRR